MLPRVSPMVPFVLKGGNRYNTQKIISMDKRHREITLELLGIGNAIYTKLITDIEEALGGGQTLTQFKDSDEFNISFKEIDPLSLTIKGALISLVLSFIRSKKLIRHHLY